MDVIQSKIDKALEILSIWPEEEIELLKSSLETENYETFFDLVEDFEAPYIIIWYFQEGEDIFLMGNDKGTKTFVLSLISAMSEICSFEILYFIRSITFGEKEPDREQMYKIIEELSQEAVNSDGVKNKLYTTLINYCIYLIDQ